MIAAKDVREERTGLHAHVGIVLNGAVMAHSVFNIGRDEDRTKLANSAAKQMKAIGKEYSADALKMDLSLFCLELAETFHDRFEITETAGVRMDTSARFILRPYILNHAGTILFGPPGAGKSWLTYTLALSVHFGLNTYWPVKRARVLFVNLERSQKSVEHRFAQLMPILGVKGTLPMLHARGSSLALVAERCRRAVQAGGIEVVFLDSISRGGGGSLIKDDVANETVDVLNSICPTWFAIGHTARENGDHIFGSQHFDAGADMTVKLSSEQRGDSLGIRMEITKANDIRRPMPELLSLEFAPGAEDSDLVDIRPVRPGEFPELAAAKSLTPLERIESYLSQIGKGTTSQIAKETMLDGGAVSRILTKSGRFLVVERKGKEVYYGIKDTQTT